MLAHCDVCHQPLRQEQEGKEESASSVSNPPIKGNGAAA
jgi:cytochrome c